MSKTPRRHHSVPSSYDPKHELGQHPHGHQRHRRLPVSRNARLAIVTLTTALVFLAPTWAAWFVGACFVLHLFVKE